MRPTSVTRSPIRAGSDVLSILIGLGATASRSSANVCLGRRRIATDAAPTPLPQAPKIPATVEIGGKKYQTDEWHNVPSTINTAVGRQLHLQKDHPISITRQIIESVFPAPTYKYHNNLFPVVTTHQNFDSLEFAQDHPGRSRTDTYYVNKDTVLRTHTSAHQADTFRRNESEGFLVSADVYRRDAIDRSHYPIFHQMEGARMWDRTKVPGGDIAKAVWEDIAKLPTHDMKVEDPSPPHHAERNPLQAPHSAAESEAISAHLKRSLELMVSEIFSRARASSGNADAVSTAEPLRIRWVEAFFPFTSPSWELEVFWQGDWLEVLGSGVINQKIFTNSGVPDQLGWAFGIGLERIAMLLFEIPDIRLFWSRDERFLGQFKGVTDDLTLMKRFVPFSKHPACYKDVAFWLRSTSSAAGGGTTMNSQDFHENDMMEILRDIAGDTVEDVKAIDEFTHPKTGRKSLCYRINYRSLERTLTNDEANKYHDRVRKELVERFGVELRSSQYVAQSPRLALSARCYATNGEASKAAEEGAAAPEDAAAKDLEAKNKEIVELKDKYLRSVADYRNLQERTKREIQSAKDFAIQKFAKDLVESVDNLDRALTMVPEEKLSPIEKNEHVNDLINLYDGLKMTEGIMMQTLLKHGLERINPAVEEKFDPNFMEAMFMSPMAGKEDNTVLLTQRKGWKLNGRTMRAAQVGVVRNT
ncbi:hypothetical protein V501_02761 [Pseudogymnoascus sp. VKM F-4519 (FW-2642)]|nr:hypothetical protein V501_02761 [Pseudogymnoascus sp. VKM F-4519 (FW-2642)]